MATQVVLLGTGTPNNEPDRAQSSLAVIVDGQPYLVDCGGGVIQRIAQAYAQGITALHPHQADATVSDSFAPRSYGGVAGFDDCAVGAGAKGGVAGVGTGRL